MTNVYTSFTDTEVVIINYYLAYSLHYSMYDDLDSNTHDSCNYSNSFKLINACIDNNYRYNEVNVFVNGS